MTAGLAAAALARPGTGFAAQKTAPRFGWSWSGHIAIEEAGSRLLPIGTLRQFVENQAKAIQAASAQQDKTHKGPGHYINLEHHDVPPPPESLYFRDIRRVFTAQNQQTKEQTFRQSPLQGRTLGYPPGHSAPHPENVLIAIMQHYRQLVGRFQQATLPRINPEQRAEAERQLTETIGSLAHYVGDLHQPLHTTQHYDWDLAYSSHKTAHKYLERNVMQPADYQRWHRRTPHTPMPTVDEAAIAQHMLREIERGYLAVYDLVTADRQARSPGKRQAKTREAYLARLSQAWRPIVENRMTEAAKHLAMILQSAYAAAGQPKLGSSG